MEPNRGVMLAIAILLLWLAGLSFFVAFEGTKLIGSAGVAGGGSASYIGKLEQGLAGQVQQAAQNTGGTP